MTKSDIITYIRENLLVVTLGALFLLVFVVSAISEIRDTIVKRKLEKKAMLIYESKNIDEYLKYFKHTLFLGDEGVPGYLWDMIKHLEKNGYKYKQFSYVPYNASWSFYPGYETSQEEIDRQKHENRQLFRDLIDQKILPPNSNPDYGEWTYLFFTKK